MEQSEVLTNLQGYLQKYMVEKSCLNTLDVKDIVKTCFKALDMDELNNPLKKNIYELLLVKLSMYRIKPQEIEKLVDKGPGLIREDGANVSEIIKMFLHIAREDIVYKIFKDTVHLEREQRSLVTPNLIYMLKYITSRNSELKTKEDVDFSLDFMEVLYAEGGIHVKMDIADQFILNGRATRGHQMLAEIREIENIHADLLNGQQIGDFLRNGRLREDRKKSGYTDSQNVHHSEINGSVLKAAFNMIMLYPPQDFIKRSPFEFTGGDIRLKEIKYVFDRLKDGLNEGDLEKLNMSLQRIWNDPTNFSLNKNRFQLIHIFKAIYQWATRATKDTDEAISRLKQELVDTSVFCCSGYMARLLSTIQGLQGQPPDTEIKVSDATQIKNILFYTIQKEMPEKIIDAMTMLDTDVYYPYVVEKVNSRIDDLLDNYQASHDNIIDAVTNFTGYRGWRIEDRKLTY